MYSLNKVQTAVVYYLLLSYLAEILSGIRELSLMIVSKINVIYTQAALKLFSPIIMMEDDENYKDRFKVIIVAIIVLVVGAVTVSIVSGVGLYILNVFNTTAVKIPANYNYVSPIAPTLGSIFQILVVVLIIIALFFVIRYLMKSTDTF